MDWINSFIASNQPFMSKTKNHYLSLKVKVWDDVLLVGVLTLLCLMWWSVMWGHHRGLCCLHCCSPKTTGTRPTCRSSLRTLQWSGVAAVDRRRTERWWVTLWSGSGWSGRNHLLLNVAKSWTEGPTPRLWTRRRWADSTSEGAEILRRAQQAGGHLLPVCCCQSLFCAAVCWGSSVRAANTNRLDKLTRKAGTSAD